MIDLAFWLAYLISGGIAFAAMHYKRWRITSSTLAGTAVGVALSLLILLAIPRDDRSPWFQVELAVNGSLAMIFAGAGAAIAFAMRTPRD